MIFHVSSPLCTAGLLLLHHRDAGDTRCAEGGWRGGQLRYRAGCDNHMDAEGCALPVIVCMHACKAACCGVLLVLTVGRYASCFTNCVVPVCVPLSCVSISVLQMVLA